MATAALPGFLVIGPMYHFFHDLCNGSSVGAVALTSCAESAIFYGSETKNAQAAYNLDAEKKGAKPISKIQSQYNPLGPGLGLHIVRNFVAMSGIRVVSQPCQDALGNARPDMNPVARTFLGELLANVVVSALSTPLHQLYGFVVTNRAAAAEHGVAQESLVSASRSFLRSQYLTPSGRVSSVAARDVFLRVAYNASIFTMYGPIERAFVAYWPKQLNWKS